MRNGFSCFDLFNPTNSFFRLILKRRCSSKYFCKGFTLPQAWQHLIYATTEKLILVVSEWLLSHSFCWWIRSRRAVASCTAWKLEEQGKGRVYFHLLWMEATPGILHSFRCPIERSMWTKWWEPLQATGWHRSIPGSRRVSGAWSSSAWRRQGCYQKGSAKGQLERVLDGNRETQT